MADKYVQRRTKHILKGIKVIHEGMKRKIKNETK
jgi:hypothetical protein